MAQNPYSMVFGRSPSQLISRRTQADQITETFNADDPAQRVFMITGVRGSGKTVFMTETVRHFAKESRWITVELNPDRDLLTGLAARLSSENYLAKLFQTARINLSFFGFGLEVGGSVPITDIETALEKMFESIKKEGKRVLIAIDEVTSKIGRAHV